MTQQEASEHYKIPVSILKEYESWGLCGAVKTVMGAWQYDGEDLQRLSTIMTLHDIGFTTEEVETYMRLLLEQPDSSAQRLNMMEKKRSEILDEIHFHERQLQRLDYLRHEMQKNKECSIMKKCLVAYFSASGETARLAKTLSGVTGGDLFEIQPEQRYTAADLNWNDRKSRSTLEMNDDQSRPAIASHVADMTQYDTVFVGFPIWWYQAPRIIETFLESYDFSGKTVIAFATSGGSGMGKTESILKKCCSAKWLPGKRLSSREKAASVQKWVDGLGL